MFEKTKWISKKVEENGLYTVKEQDNVSILLRKNFDIQKQVKSAVLNICALGVGVYTLNGKRITDDVLCTPYTVYDKRVIYQTYDITDKLSLGTNAIGVHVGNGFYNENMGTWYRSTLSWKDRPKAAVQLDIKYADGESETVVTDSSWKACYGPCTYNHARQGEIYDMNLKQKGFDTPEFDDSEWDRAIVVSSPGGRLEPMDMPPIRVVRTLKPVSVCDGVYDFGENISGWVRVRATGEKGREMHIKYEEWILENGEFFGHIDRFNRQRKLKLSHENYVIFSGEKDEEYSPSFCYHGFRYVKVTNAPIDLEIEAQVVHTDLETIGSFTCDDDMLNKIHAASVRSTLSNYHGVPTDCPHREQNGWTGDAHLSAEQSLKNFDMHKAYTKWLRDFKDVQRPSGQLPGIIPTSSWGFNNWNGPAWDSALIIIPLYMYNASGNTDIIKDMWDNIERYMNYLDTMSEDYIIDYGLGDWCALPCTDICSVALTSTAYYYADAVACKKMAALIGKDTDRWDTLAQNIRASWRARFMSEKSNYKRQTFFAMAIYHGLLENEEIPVFAKKLVDLITENGFHIDCGILGTKCIFTALSETGYTDVLYKMITVPTMPSYAYWINRGMTTFAECWDLSCSQNHHMYSEVDNWFYKYLGGLDLEDGNVVIKPYIVPGINHVKVTWRDVEVERKENMLYIKTSRPVKLVINNENTELAEGTYSFELA